MSKYGSGITIRRQCMYEVAELRHRLGKYNIPKDEIDEIADMLAEPYFQLKEMADSGCVMDEFLREKVSEKDYADFLSFGLPDSYMDRLARYKKSDKAQFDGSESEATELAWE